MCAGGWPMPPRRCETDQLGLDPNKNISHPMSSDHHDAPSTAPASSTPEWVDEYNSVLAKREYKAPVIPGPHCCSICCTFFSSIGALFLFLISGLLKSHYPYVHIEGDLQAMASSTGYAGAFGGWLAGHTHMLGYFCPFLSFHMLLHFFLTPPAFSVHLFLLCFCC